MSLNLQEWIVERQCTLLGVGPMSRNCVDAAIEIAGEHEIPLMLIASRRQIDSAEFGGGYVANWTTEAFASYVRKNDRKGKVLLARDHGGPWQNTKETAAKMTLKEAMASAKRSYDADIAAGFDILHIDPSIDPTGAPTVDEVIGRIMELYEHCWATAQKAGREPLFEIGTEDQMDTANSFEELEYVLSQTKKLCARSRLPAPTFVVVQTGTKVKETHNVGTFLTTSARTSTQSHIRQLLHICAKQGVFMKEHNTDYLPNEALALHPKLGIHAANVAPEFGVAETVALLRLLDKANLKDLKEKFVTLAYDSKKWDKWMLPNTTAGRTERAVIAGHYVFARPEFAEIKAEADAKLRPQNITVDSVLKTAAKESILRYVTQFNLSSKLSSRKAA